MKEQDHGTADEATPFDQATGHEAVLTPEDAASWVKVGERQGYSWSEGGWYETPAGDRKYVKAYEDSRQSMVEHMANELYALAAIPAVQSELVMLHGKTGVASAQIRGATAVTEESLAASNTFKNGFVVDAWLANRDVTGPNYDNVLEDHSGKLVRAGNGAALMFRAQGQIKDFAVDSIPELESMRDPRYPAGKIFQTISDDEISIQAQSLVDHVTEDDIRRVIAESGISGRAAQMIEDGLIGRRQYLIDHYSLRDEPLPREFEPSSSDSPQYHPSHPAYEYLQNLRPPDLDTSEQAALQDYSGAESDELNALVESGQSNSTTRRLDSAIAKTTLQESVVVYSGMGPAYSDPTDFPKKTIFEEKRYRSTTLDKTIARGWRDSHTVLKITLPAGAHVAVANAKESELLLPHGSRFEITGARSVDDGDYTLVSARLILAPETTPQDQGEQAQQARQIIAAIPETPAPETAEQQATSGPELAEVAKPSARLVSRLARRIRRK